MVERETFQDWADAAGLTHDPADDDRFLLQINPTTYVTGDDVYDAADLVQYDDMAAVMDDLETVQERLESGNFRADKHYDIDLASTWQDTDTDTAADTEETRGYPGYGRRYCWQAYHRW